MSKSALSQCIERERALVEPYAHATTARGIMRIFEDMKVARVATDEAVRAIESEISSLRQQNWTAQPPMLTREHLRFLRILDDVNRLDDDDHDKLRAIVAILSASPFPEGESTGGEDDGNGDA